MVAIGGLLSALGFCFDDNTKAAEATFVNSFTYLYLSLIFMPFGTGNLFLSFLLVVLADVLPGFLGRPTGSRARRGRKHTPQQVEDPPRHASASAVAERAGVAGCPPILALSLVASDRGYCIARAGSEQRAAALESCK